jgi:hypothetical protein
MALKEWPVFHQHTPFCANRRWHYAQSFQAQVIIHVKIWAGDFAGWEVMPVEHHVDVADGVLNKEREFHSHGGISIWLKFWFRWI